MAAAPTSYLLLIRHGATANNLAKPPLLQGRGIDFDLSAEGVTQAERTAAFLASQPIAAVYSSPLVRARQTAEAIARPHGLAVELIEALTECDVGAWEGRSWPDIEREEPEAYQRFHENPYDHGYRDGETMRQVEERSAPVLERLMAENLGRRIVVVAHNVVNRTYLGGLLEVPATRRRIVPQDNCGINFLRHRDGQTKVLSVNAVFHLEAADGES